MPLRENCAGSKQFCDALKGEAGHRKHKTPDLGVKLAAVLVPRPSGATTMNYAKA
jgi:hypothetical protein